MQAPKSKASRRAVPLAANAATRCGEHRLATGRPAGSARVLFAPTGPVDAHSALPRVPASRARRRGSLHRPPNPHDARHAYATWAARRRHLRHTVSPDCSDTPTPTLVLRRYGHALPDELAGAADTVSAWLDTREADNEASKR